MNDKFMYISIAVVAIIILLIAVLVCKMCFQKPNNSVNKYISNRSAYSGSHMLEGTDINSPSLTDSLSAFQTSPAKQLPENATLQNLFDTNKIRKKVATNLIAKSNRSSAPCSSSRVVSHFLTKHDGHLHAGVVVCDQDLPEAKITVFDKTFSDDKIGHLSALFEAHENAERAKGFIKKPHPTFIITSSSEGELLRRLQTAGFNRKLSLTQRMSENSGLKLPAESPYNQYINYTSNGCMSESGHTIYDDPEIFKFIDNEILSKLDPEEIVYNDNK